MLHVGYEGIVFCCCCLVFAKTLGFFLLLLLLLILFYFLTLQYCIGFAIYQNESATGIHVLLFLTHFKTVRFHMMILFLLFVSYIARSSFPRSS